MKAEWQRKPLSSILSILNGYAFDAKAFSVESGTPLIRIRDLKNGVTTQTNFDGPFDQRYVVTAGSFLIGMDGDFGCFEWHGPDALLNQRVCKLHSFAAEIDPRFLFYGINKHLKEIEDNTTFTTVKHLSSKQVANIEFAFPPIDEQRRIVAVLDKAFAGIATATANVQKNLTNARALFESYLEAIATGQGDGWAVAPLGDVCETQYGISGTMNTSGVGYKIFRMGEVQNGRMIDTGQMKHIDIPDTEFETYRLRKGDVLFNRTNSIALVGKTGVFSLDGQYCFASYLIRVKFDAKKMSSRFAGYVMNSKSFLERVRSQAAQSVNQANINATILRAEVISYPVDLAVQDEIVERLDAFSAHIQSLQLAYQKKLSVLTELKQSVLQKAFAGELS